MQSQSVENERTNICLTLSTGKMCSSDLLCVLPALDQCMDCNWPTKRVSGAFESLIDIRFTTIHALGYSQLMPASDRGVGLEGIL